MKMITLLGILLFLFIPLISAQENNPQNLFGWVFNSIRNIWEFILGHEIKIYNAEHLNNERDFISDVSNYVNSLNNIWVDIPNGDYLRVYYDENLTKDNDITIYAKGRGDIEVYKKDDDKLITTFENINEARLYKVYLTNLYGSSDAFDLKSIGDIQYDYVTDPSNISDITFIPVTPTNGTTTLNVSFIANISIITNVSYGASGSDDYLLDLKWNFNGTNYTIINTSLVLMYNFDNRSSLGESSTIARDLSKNNYTGAITQAIWTSSGKYNGAYQFDGIDDLITTGNVAIGNTFTVGVWVKPGTMTGSYYDRIIENNYGSHFYLGTDVTNTKYKWIVNNAGLGTCDGGTITPGTWQYLTGTYNGTTGVLYVNAVEVKNEVFTNPSAVNIPIYIGGYSGAGYKFNGSMDEVRIWNRSLTPQEVYEQYASNLNRFNRTQWYFYINQSKNVTAKLDNGTYTYYASAKNSMGNENKTEVRTLIIGATPDTTPPSCVVLSRTPADINDSSTGQFQVILNCSDASGINVSFAPNSTTEYNSFITRTLEGLLTPGLPNRWSIRPPANNLAQTDTLLSAYGQIMRAFLRGDNDWFEFLKPSTVGFTDDRNLSSWLLYDNYSYAVGDGKYGYYTITNTSSTTALINYTMPSVRMSVFKQNIPLSYESLIAEVKKNATVGKNAQLLVYRNDLEAMKGTKNYSVTIFRNIGTTTLAPTALLRVFYCNSSYNPLGGVTVLASPNCVNTNSLSPAQLAVKVLTEKNSSYSTGTFSVTNGMIGGIAVTPYQYTYYDSLETSASKKYLLAYANGTTQTNVSFKNTNRTWTSTTSGATWTNLQGTIDMLSFTVKENNDKFHFGYCVYDLAGNIGCNKTVFNDTITQTNHPISNPVIIDYNSSAYINDMNLNETHKGLMNIRIGCAKDPDSVGNVTHNLTLRNLDGTYNYTINTSFKCPNDEQTWINFNTSLVLDSKYRMNLTAKSGDNANDIDTYLTANNFTIGNVIPDTTPPTFNNLRSFSNYVNTPFSQSITANDSLGIDSYWLNDTSYFSIGRTTGLISNSTNLSRIELHWLNISVNDTSSNIATGVFYINVINLPPVSTCNSITSRILTKSISEKPYIQLCYKIDFK